MFKFGLEGTNEATSSHVNDEMSSSDDSDFERDEKFFVFSIFLFF